MSRGERENRELVISPFARYSCLRRGRKRVKDWRDYKNEETVSCLLTHMLTSGLAFVCTMLPRERVRKSFLHQALSGHTSLNISKNWFPTSLYRPSPTVLMS